MEQGVRNLFSHTPIWGNNRRADVVFHGRFLAWSGGEGASRILTGARERANQRHLSGLLEAVGAAHIKSKWPSPLGVAEARKAYFQAGSINQKARAAGALESALSWLLVLRESYPALKSNESFLKLQDQLEGTENRLAVERRRYNDAVRTVTEEMSAMSAWVARGSRAQAEAFSAEIKPEGTHSGQLPHAPPIHP